MSKTVRIILYVIGGIIVLNVIGRLTGANKNNQAVATETAKPLTKVQQDSVNYAAEKAIKDNTITADNLVGYYSENEVKADNELKDKEFYVSGKIDNIGKDITNSIYVTLKSNDPIRNVQCFIDDANVVANLQKGQKILVKGKCAGLMMNVLMKDCELIK